MGGGGEIDLRQSNSLHGCYMGGCFCISGLFSIQDIIYKQSIEPLRRFTGFIFFTFSAVAPF